MNLLEAGFNLSRNCVGVSAGGRLVEAYLLLVHRLQLDDPAGGKRGIRSDNCTGDQAHRRQFSSGTGTPVARRSELMSVVMFGPPCVAGARPVNL